MNRFESNAHRVHSSPAYATNRYHIHKWGKTWDVWQGQKCIKECATPAEAFAYAQEHAKTEALKEPS